MVKFIGEFQLRTEFPEKVMLDIGSVGYAVKLSEQGKGYGTAILRLSLELTKQHIIEKVLLINDENIPSMHICGKTDPLRTKSPQRIKTISGNLASRQPLLSPACRKESKHLYYAEYGQ